MVQVVYPAYNKTIDMQRGMCHYIKRLTGIDLVNEVEIRYDLCTYVLSSSIVEEVYDRIGYDIIFSNAYCKNGNYFNFTNNYLGYDEYDDEDYIDEDDIDGETASWVMVKLVNEFNAYFNLDFIAIVFTFEFEDDED